MPPPKSNKGRPNRVGSLKELALACNLSLGCVTKYSKMEGWPGRDSSTGFYWVSPCRDFILANSSAFNSDEETDNSTKGEIEKEKLRKLKTFNDEQDGLLLRKEHLAKLAAPTLESIKELLYQKLENEIPIALAGVDVPQGRIIGRRHADELLLKWKELIERWGV